MLEEAFMADDMYKRCQNKPLEGVPIGIKDNIDIIQNDTPVTAGTSTLL
jgi:Asp-tRNA(Asn)/Glu-tRNA(Gln) amidotransferase A subunit family amidase